MTRSVASTLNSVKSPKHACLCRRFTIDENVFFVLVAACRQRINSIDKYENTVRRDVCSKIYRQYYIFSG